MLAALKNPDSVDTAILHLPDPPLSAPVAQQSIAKNPLLLLGIVAVITAMLTILVIVLLAKH